MLLEQALFTAAVRDGERLTGRHLRVALSGDADLAESVRDLADRETQCCSFFAFTARPWFERSPSFVMIFAWGEEI